MSTRFPVPPGVVARVVQAAADPNTRIADLSRLLETDPVLTAQVLRCVNSAEFGLRHKIASVEHAIAMMGVRAVRNLALSMGVRDLVPMQSLGALSLETFWEFSLRRAAAAQCLAERLELPHIEEFFTLGLCQDIGVLARVREDENLTTRLGQALLEASDVRLAIERECGEGHDQAGHDMFAAWNFPEELTLPMLHHHDPSQAPEAHAQRAQVSHAAEAIADFSMIENKAVAMKAALQRLEALEIAEGSLVPIVDRVDELANHFADLMGLKLARQPSSEEIIAMAGEGLAELNLSYAELNRRLEDSLAEQQRMADRLKALNADLALQASTDALTGLANRRCFEELLDRELAIAERQGSPISLLILDVDLFKQVNDTKGHPAGDRVLQRIGHAIAEQMRATDVAARIGGEEFALILPFTDRPGGEIAAERFRKMIEELKIPWLEEELQVTASAGGATLSNVQHPWNTYAKVAMAMADEALYEAKRAGRNTVRWADDAEITGAIHTEEARVESLAER